MTPETQVVQEVTPQEAFQELDSGDAILIDTREPHEYAESHIDGANLIPPAMVADNIADKVSGQVRRGSSFPAAPVPVRRPPPNC